MKFAVANSFFLFCAAFFAVVPVPCAEAEEAEANPCNDDSPELLCRQLGASSAIARRRATRCLVGLGQQSLAAVRVAAQSQDPEVRRRAFYVLAGIFGSESLTDSLAARNTLQQLAESNSPSIASLARSALISQQSKAMIRLAKLGVVFESPSRGQYLKVTIDEKFLGTDTSLVSLRWLPHLESIRISTNKITDRGLKNVAAIPSLKDVAILDAPITGGGLTYLKDLPNLEALHLSRTAVQSGDIKILLCHHGLRWLDLRGTRVDDTAIDTLVQFEQLDGLDLRETRLTPAGASRLLSKVVRTKVLVSPSPTNGDVSE